MILSICGFDVDLDKIASMNFDVDSIDLFDIGDIDFFNVDNISLN